jgi:ketosteroid isomerase-like protein
MSRERVERVRRGYDAFNRGDYEAALDGFAEDVVWEVLDMLPDAGPFVGKQGVLTFWEMWREQFTGFRVEIEETEDLGEQVLAMMRVHGTGRDSGAEVATSTMVQLWTLRGEKIVRVQMFSSREEALEAI